MKETFRKRDTIWRTSDVLNDGAMTLEAISNPGKYLTHTKKGKLTIHRPWDEKDNKNSLF
jgi:hypothetical protein